MAWLKERAALLVSMGLNIFLVAAVVWQAHQIMLLKIGLAQLEFVLKLIMSQGQGGPPIQ